METLNRNRAQALNKLGNECHLLYLQHGAGLQNISEIPVFVTDGKWGIRNHLRMYTYDTIVVCSDYKLLFYIKKFGFKGKLIFEMQGLGSYDEATAFILKAKQFIIKNADGILIPKTNHLINLSSTYLSQLPIFNLNNCFHLDSFSYQRFPKPEAPIIGWVGRIEHNKNWKGFLLVAKQILQIYPKIEFWMFEDSNIGDPLERKYFLQMVDDLHIADKIKRFSNIPHKDMAKYYSMIGDSGGFLLFTSRVEGFGYAAVEALACRCPVLTNDSDGVKSFIKHNISGKITNIDDIEATILQAKELMENTALRNYLIQNGIEIIKRDLNPDGYAKEFINMLLKIHN